jgi:hypothetical protein
MTPQEIQERNEQIALMLGWKNSFAHKVDQYGYHQTVDGYSTPYINTLDEQAVEYQSDKNAFAIEDLQFHSDWNWLHEAAEKVYSLTHPSDSIRHDIIHILGRSHKEAVFIAVSDFAKLYNEKKL